MIEYIIGLFIVLIVMTLAWKLLKSLIKVALVGVILVVVVYAVLTYMDISSTDDFNSTIDEFLNGTNTTNSTTVINETTVNGTTDADADTTGLEVVTGKVTDTYKQDVAPKIRSKAKEFFNELFFGEA